MPPAAPCSHPDEQMPAEAGMHGRGKRGASHRRFAGRWAKIVTSEPVQRQTAFNGRVTGMDGDDVLFESEGRKPMRLPLRLISRARLEVEF